MTDANVKPTSPTSQWGGLWYSGEKPTSLDDEKLCESELPASPRRSMCVHTVNSKIEFILGDATTKFTIVVAHNGFLTPPPSRDFTPSRAGLTLQFLEYPAIAISARPISSSTSHIFPHLGHISRLGLAAYCTEWPKAHSHMRRAVHAAAHTLSLAAHGARRTSRPRTMATRPAAPCRHTGRRKFSTVPAAGATTGSVKIFLSPPLMCRKRAWPPGI